MNNESKLQVQNALAQYAIGTGTGLNASMNYGCYPWTPNHYVHYTFNSDTEAKIKAIRAILKLKIDDSDKVEAVEAILK